MNKIYLALIFVITIGTGYSQTVSLYAGQPQTPGHNPTGVNRLSAYLAYPFGLAFDSQGRLWITNYGGDYGSGETGHTISVIMPNGTLYTRSGTYGQPCLKTGTGIGLVNTRYTNPAGIAIGPGDTIYIADQGNHVIRIMTPLTSLANPQTSTVLAGKYSYVNPTDYCYTTYPGFKDGPGHKAQFNEPTGIDVDDSGNVYVADKNNHCIRKIDRHRRVTTIAGQPGVPGDVDGPALSAKFNYPTGVYYDKNTGDLYITEFGNGQLRKLSANGQVTTIVDDPLNSFPIWTWNPIDVRIDNLGNIYISDSYRILKHKGNKTSVFAGGPYHNGYAGYVNDTGTAARFDNIKQLAVDPNNNNYIYAADFNNQAIRKIVICQDYKPTITTSGNTITCLGDTVTLTAEAGFNSYSWSTGDTTRTIKITKKGSYNVVCTVLNDDGCYGYSDPIHVEINQLTPNIQLDGPSQFCDGGSVLLIGQGGLDYYKWQKDGVTVKEGVQGVASSLKVTSSGNYTLIGTKGPCTGTSKVVKIVVTDHVVPTIDIDGDTNLCDGDRVIMQTRASYDTYDWKKDGTSTGITSRSITITQAGSYSVYVTHQATNCTGESYPIQVTVRPAPDKPTITVLADSTLQSSSPTGNQWYRYDSLLPGATGQTFKPDRPGYYKVAVTNSYGCTKFSDPINYGNTSVDDYLNLKQFTVYPVPANQSVYCKGQHLSSGTAIISVKNILGQTVFQQKVRYSEKLNYKIDVSSWKQGVYFLEINEGDLTYTYKIIKAVP